MRSSSAGAALLLGALLLVSCDGGDEPTDAGTPRDAGPGPSDAGGADDASLPGCEADPPPDTPREAPTLSPGFRGATSLGLATNDITNRTGENPTTSTWDGRVIVRRCPDPSWPADDYAEDPVGGQPGVVRGQYWCFHAFRPARVTLDADGTPDFRDAFGPGFTSTTRHVSHSGGFPVVENLSPEARWNPYRSTVDGTACGLASVEPAPPPCPAQRYETYDLYIVHAVDLSNPTLSRDYPDHPLGEGTPTYFERMRVVVRDPETVDASVVDVIRDQLPYPMEADPGGFGFVYDPSDDSLRNPYLHRSPSDPGGTTYVGGVASIEPGATNDGRMVIWNGGDEHPTGVNLTYSWNADPAARAGWSPPKNVAYMYFVEGPGAPGGETMIPIDGELVPFSEVFPIASQPLRDQSGVTYDPGSTYVPAIHNAAPVEYPYRFEGPITQQMYLGSYPWLSWDGRHIMSLAIGRFNVAVIGDLTGHTAYWIDGGIDRTDFRGPAAHEISAMWNLGQWPGRWAQYQTEFEGRARAVPTRLRDAATWAIFEQDHYSEVSFHRTDGSYAVYFPMSRMSQREPPSLYREGFTPDVSGSFHTGALVPTSGQVDFSQSFSDGGFDRDALSRSFGFVGNSIGFLTDAADPAAEPHVAADPIDGLDRALTAEGAVYLYAQPGLPAGAWTTIVRQAGSFALGVDPSRRPYFEITDTDGAVTRVTGPEPVGDNRWVHLAGVYDSLELRLLVDAREVAVAPGTGLAVAPASDRLALGPKNDGTSPGGHGQVLVDEVGVTLGARSFEEIAHDAGQRIEWPTATLGEWEQMWGAGSMPLGLVDETGALLAPIHLDYAPSPSAPERIALGERLFHDGALSTTDPPISCESCHTLTREHMGARRGEPLSTQGAGPIPRHTPTVFNRVFGREQFWDGRADGLAEQLLFPIESPVEMNMPLDRLTGTVLAAAGYEPDFCSAFGTAHTTLPRLQEAITLYESGLVAGNSALDRHRFRAEPMSDAARRGWALFRTKARCIGCHAPPLYADERFHDNAQGDESDPGRAAFTGRPRDFGRFRTMSLRDVERTPPYMHDGSVPTLRDVIEGYDRGGDEPGELDVRPLHLTPSEIDDLVELLRALRSEQTVVPLR